MVNTTTSSQSAAVLSPSLWVQQRLLAGRSRVPVKATATAYAPANIALCKYWGKRDLAFNLPMTSSLSVSLADKGTHTNVSVLVPNAKITSHQLNLNGNRVPADSAFFIKVNHWLSLFLPDDVYLQIDTSNTIPTAAGLASSASGFAALSKACDHLFDWNLPPSHLSALARLGSGSACRSLWHGFVKWHGGTASDGSDSIAEPLANDWEQLRVGIITVSEAVKSVSSSVGMQRTLSSSRLYGQWPEQVAHDLPIIEKAIAEQDILTLGATSEHNAMTMHATMASAWPPLVYWQPESLAAMQRVWHLREDGVEVYFTMDAGPNLKLIFLSPAMDAVQSAFAGVDVVAPMAASTLLP